jgi:hypothetical protein
LSGTIWFSWLFMLLVYTLQGFRNLKKIISP